MSDVVDHAGLPAGKREALWAELARLYTLADVIKWGLAQSPERTIVDVVIQDEYHHDVVMDWEGDLHLVFDTS